MKALKGNSLIYKFLVAAALPVLLLLVFANIVFVAVKVDTVQENRLAELESDVSQMAAQLATPVWQFDTTTVSSLMQALLEIPNIKCVRLEEYESYASEVRAQNLEGECAELESGNIENDSLIESSIIYTYEGQALRIGLLSTHADTSDLGDAIARSLLSDLILFLLYVAIFMTGFILALKATVLRPLQKVEDSLREHELTGERHLVEWKSTDELGRFINAYNTSVQKTKDIERKLVEQNKGLEAARMSAEQARDIAESAAKAKTEFLANMSHEIRTPMNAIIGLSEMMKKTRLEAKQSSYLQRIVNSADILMAIINDILDFSKIEAGKLELEEVAFDLDLMIEKLADVEAVAVSEKKLDLIFSIASDVPDSLVGDPMRLSQVLINLISNAVKFTERGNIVVSVGLESIGKDGCTLLFMVKDTGLGIEQAVQQRLFDAFTQADGSTTRRFGGTGLGLAICRRLVECMGGEISVSSQVGEGSTFRFTADFKLVEGYEQKLVMPTLIAMNTRTIVVGNSRSCHELTKILRQHGYEVAGADNARLALGQVEESVLPEECEGIVFLDTDAARMSVPEFIEQLRSFSGWQVIPLVNIVSQTSMLELDKQSGVRVQLTKPVLRRRVLQALELLRSEPVDESDDEEICDLPLNGACILVVEDNSVNQMVAREFLEEAGATVRVADNGAEALTRLDDRSVGYDLVLMDVHMPVMDGYRATIEIRRHHGKGLPIVALTANATTDEKKRCLEAGMDDFLTKPIDGSLLLDVVQKWLYRGGFRPKMVSLPDKEAETMVEPTQKTGHVTKPVRKGQDGQRIDWADLQKRFDAHKHIIPRVLQSFVDSFATFEDDYEAAMEAGDTDTMYRLAHSLKGGAANISAEALRELALNLENKLNTQDMQAAREWYPWVVDDLQKVSAELSALLADEPQLKENLGLT